MFFIGLLRSVSVPMSTDSLARYVFNVPESVLRLHEGMALEDCRIGTNWSTLGPIILWPIEDYICRER